jgi:hypothetical protein
MSTRHRRRQIRRELVTANVMLAIASLALVASTSAVLNTGGENATSVTALIIAATVWALILAFAVGVMVSAGRYAVAQVALERRLPRRPRPEPTPVSEDADVYVEQRDRVVANGWVAAVEPHGPSALPQPPSMLWRPPVAPAERPLAETKVFPAVDADVPASGWLLDEEPYDAGLAATEQHYGREKTGAVA